jgi:hypothetical protein
MVELYILGVFLGAFVGGSSYRWGGISPIPLEAAVSARSSRSGAGASARAHYAALAAERRKLRLAVVASAALVAFIVGVLLLGWEVGLALALWAAGSVLVWQRRHDSAGTWRRGAAGERRTARMLAPLTRRGFTVLHDRALPRSRANLDHLVIGAGGVLIVDSKNWAKDKLVKGRGRGLRVGRVSGRTVVKSALFEMDRVREALRRDLGREIPVAAVLAVHGARLPYWRTLQVDGVPILQASRVRGWITRRPQQLAAMDVPEIAAACMRLFPAYVEPGTGPESAKHAK